MEGMQALAIRAVLTVLKNKESQTKTSTKKNNLNKSLFQAKKKGGLINKLIFHKKLQIKTLEKLLMLKLLNFLKLVKPQETLQYKLALTIIKESKSKKRNLTNIRVTGSFTMRNTVKRGVDRVIQVMNKIWMVTIKKRVEVKKKKMLIQERTRK